MTIAHRSASFRVPGGNGHSGCVFRDWRSSCPRVSLLGEARRDRGGFLAHRPRAGDRDRGPGRRESPARPSPGLPDVVDPQKSSFVNEIDILQLVYEGLTRLDTNQETVPAAAESWEYNEDATQITFQLRPDLKYSDGSPLTAENFRYAIQRNRDPKSLVSTSRFSSKSSAALSSPRSAPMTRETPLSSRPSSMKKRALAWA